MLEQKLRHLNQCKTSTKNANPIIMFKIHCFYKLKETNFSVKKFVKKNINKETVYVYIYWYGHCIFSFRYSLYLYVFIDHLNLLLFLLSVILNFYFLFLAT